MEHLKIALVADIHVGETRSNIQSGDALALLRDVVAAANAETVDLFVTLGDNVNSTGVDADSRNLSCLRDVLADSTAPVVPLFGNNDLKFLDATSVATALRCHSGSERRSMMGWTLLFWRPNCDISLENGGPTLTSDDLAWLQEALAASSHPTVLFLHAPIDDHATVGNYYFESRPDIASYSNGSEARALIEASGKVVLVVAGHVHWNAGSTIDGIHHRTIASLVDTFMVDGEASATWAILDLAADRIALDVRGREPMQWAAPPRKSGDHWRRPLTSDAYTVRIKAHWQNENDPAHVET